jgi:hypothetical protein
MPRGRYRQTAAIAKEETFRRLLGALAERPEGLRFTDWWRVAGVHKDTLSSWIPQLREAKLVEKVDRIYRLTEDVGLKGYKKSHLLRRITESTSFCFVGGGSALDPADDLIVKSTDAYAFPPTWLDFLEIKDLIHRRFMAFLLHRLASHHRIDPRYLTGELPPGGLLRALTEKLPKGTQVLAFTLDFDAMRTLMNEQYLSDLLRFLEQSQDMTEINRLALEAKAITFLKTGQSSGELSEIAEHIKIDEKKAEEILDGLVLASVPASTPTSMNIYDEQGNELRTVPLWPQPKRVKRWRGQEVSVEVKQSRRYLHKLTVGKRIYYSLIDPSL